MRVLKPLAVAACTWLALGTTAFADVQISIHDGQVTLVAKDATVRQILTEWARVGQTKIINVERIPGGPITLELKDVAEQQALDVLLRSVSGYMAAPRPSIISNASLFDRIIVMPTSVAPRAATAAPPVFNAAQQPVPQRLDDDVDDEHNAAGGVPGQPGRSPIFATFPQPQVVNPPQQGAPASAPGVISVPQHQQLVNPLGGPAVNYPTTTPGAQPVAPFGGAAVPGVIVQPPQQPNNGQRTIVVPSQPPSPN